MMLKKIGLPLLVSVGLFLASVDIFAGITGKNIHLSADTLSNAVILDEVVVKPKKEKYSKKNNKAVSFVEMIRRQSDLNDPYRCDNFNFSKYERITVGINDITDSVGKNGGLLEKFKFLNEYVDTSSVTGKPILPFTVKEKVSEISYRRNPRALKEYVSGIKRIGLDDITNQESVQVFLEEIFREIDLYQNDINLLSNRFVSPLSKIGPDIYKYYLTDTVNIEGELCSVLSFAPHNSAMFGFIGRLYVPLNDSTMFIKKVSMNLPKKANVNFVESLQIDQTFARADNGSRLKTADVLTVEFSIIPGTQGLYAQRYSRFYGHDFNPSGRPQLFDRVGDISVAADAYIHDDDFWNQHRIGGISDSEKQIGDLIADMRSVPLYYYTEKVLKILVSGYVSTGKDSKVDLGPINTLVSFNDVEGARFRVGGLTTAKLNPHIFARGYAAYGTKDNKLKYSAELEYSFNKKKRHSREFPVHALRLTHSYDVNALGQDYAFTNPDNFFLSLKRTKDTLMNYNRVTKLEYILELENNFSATLALAKTRKEATGYLPFIQWDGSGMSHLDFSTVTVSLRYAPGEKFYQTKSKRVPVNLDAPVFILTHTYGPAGFLGSSKYTVNKTELNIQKRFWFSAFGYADILLKGGHVWSTVPYTELLIPNANITYTIQPESFALMNPMEFMTDSYASWDITYWANGAIFNYIPLIKRLKWREVFAFRGIWGDLSDKNNPGSNHWLPKFPASANPVKMSSTPYMEVSAGIDNIFRCIRLDYVWRLTYRDTPGVDLSGLRVALHLTF